MSKIYFYYGAMNSGKSLNLITTAYSYTSKNKKVMVLTSDLDKRSGFKKIESRVGLSIDAEYFNKGTLDKINQERPDIILVDEAQFLSKEDVNVLNAVAGMYGIPVLAYGLKNDFKGFLFEGSKALLECADTIREIKTICEECGERKAVYNLRIDAENNIVLEGDVIGIDQVDYNYISVCRNCYFQKLIDVDKQV